MKKKILISAICLIMLAATVTNANATNINTQTYKVHTDNTNEKKIITIETNIKDLSDLTKHKDNQIKRIKEIKSSTISKEVKDLLRNTTATVTFKEAISLEELNKVIKDSKANLVDFEVKFLNEKNEWITGNFRVAEKSKINSAIESTISKGREKQLKFIGITSARMIVDLESKTFDNLCNSDEIYLVDITDTLVRLENGDYSKKLKIRVPDLAWEIDKIK